jgi:hypothetical protein
MWFHGNFTVFVHPYKCSNVPVDEDIAVKSEEGGHKF